MHKLLEDIIHDHKDEKYSDDENKANIINLDDKKWNSFWYVYLVFPCLTQKNALWGKWTYDSLNPYGRNDKQFFAFEELVNKVK